MSSMSTLMMAAIIPAARMVQLSKPATRRCWHHVRISKNCMSSSAAGFGYKGRLLTRESPSEGIVVLSPHGINIYDKTLTEYQWQRIGEWENRKAVTCAVTGISYSYKELRELCQRFASSLLAPTEEGGLGMKKGDVIGIMMQNGPDYPVVFHGAIEAGLVVTTANPSFTVGEISRQLSIANAKILVSSYGFLENAIAAVKDSHSCSHIIVVDNPKVDGDLQGCISYSRLISSPAQLKYLDSKGEINLRSTVVLPFSSGTEGLPKGVKLSHMNLVSSMCMVQHPEVLARHSDDPMYQDVVLGVLPLYHIFGMNAVMNVCLNMGRHNVFIPKFEPATFLNAIRKYKPTILYLVPPLLLYLAKHPGVTREDLSSFCQIVSGAATASPPVIKAFLERAGRDDIDFREGYGLTETAGVSALLPPRALGKIGSCGLLTPFTEGRVVDGTGKGLKSHEKGELLLKGPQVMEGYLNDEKATRNTLDADGWLHTGDIAYYDDEGFFYIVDRMKELIKVKGNQVSPTELEAILRQCPGVGDVAVVGVPDDRSGELPAAFVVRGPGSEVTERDVHAWMSPRAAAFKQLAGGVRFIDAIPKSPSGKVLRRELVRML
ncbi:uncharacterized protein [Hetaerina americana]|uniref:uncharacterized protein n=1 Tax=Hetaerina americana TaxID=62018 RepID=UPI003A7F5CDF